MEYCREYLCSVMKEYYSQHMPTISSVCPSSCTLMLTVISSTGVRCACSCVRLYSPNNGPDAKSPVSDVSIHALLTRKEKLFYKPLLYGLMFTEETFVSSWAIKFCNQLYYYQINMQGSTIPHITLLFPIEIIRLCLSCVPLQVVNKSRY